MPTHIRALDTKEDALEVVGGKGRSLAKLANAGFQVPGGFQVTTAAYRRFVADHDLQEQIIELARPAVVEGKASFEQSSTAIGQLFADTGLSAAISAEISDAYRALDGKPAVAVRSSANAEDLPGLSFAGQQETFLNVTGVDAVVAAVKNCWASLWTAQAISYRHQNGIAQDSVAMAVVVQRMVPAEVSGILFTANPTTGERGEMIVNASFGLGEAVVSGQVTPDTYIIDRGSKTAKETIIGPKAQKIVADGDQGIRLEDVLTGESAQSSLSDTMLSELVETALAVEQLYQGLPQDIEWAFSGGKLHLLQSRPITNLPVQPIEVDWTPRPPARFMVRQQIVDNMPDPLCPLFDELYLTQMGSKWWEWDPSFRDGKNPLVGGGANFVSLNGYAYMRIDSQRSHEQIMSNVVYSQTENREYFAADVVRHPFDTDTPDQEQHDLALMVADLSEVERQAFRAFEAAQHLDDLALQVTMPESESSVFLGKTKTGLNDRIVDEWRAVTRPRLIGVKEKWAELDLDSATDEQLLAAIREMSMEEGYYWASNSYISFATSKYPDEQLQQFLRETLPDHHFTSGQLLSGIESKTMQANEDLFEIAKRVRASDELSYLVIVTPGKFLMPKLRVHPDAGEVVAAIARYLTTYGHQGYSLDFVDPTQAEDPSGLFATLKAMVADEDYDPEHQRAKAARIREEKFKQISELLSGLQYWQFRYRLWLARRYAPVRDEISFLLGSCWSLVRPMAFELGRRLVEVGTFLEAEDTFYLVTEELNQALAARKSGKALSQLGALAAERRELREARKKHRAPAVVPEAARANKHIARRESMAAQITNDDASATMHGFAVSSGQVTARASVVLGPADFDQMEPGSILVSPLTTPAWTQLFAHAAGLVTDMGSILAHGSIVAREYGIPAVLGVGNGTERIAHGQLITIDGDAGTVVIREEV
uniref:Phosphoenolpyruvate synthase/pyruvate phosphate dikinase n=1 Tax=uncultured delta proteobacterium HF0770_45N15 TaxID=710835 RepID=E0XYY1_9DELT|nr:phosphoenolpyruvate synthase/pyruvate phosphate dikinase [uncultured delta proteobacterium HF0770_45N15]